MTKIDKLDKKYGDPVLRELSKRNEVAENYYELYLQAQREAYRDEVEGCVAELISVAMMIVGLFESSFMIPAVIFLVVGCQAFMNSRIERLWISKFRDEIFESVRIYDLEEVMNELKKQDDLFSAVAKEKEKK